MIKCKKDPTRGIFLKRGLIKDLKNDTSLCRTHKYKNTKTQIHKYTKIYTSKIYTDLRLCCLSEQNPHPPHSHWLQNHFKFLTQTAVPHVGSFRHFVICCICVLCICIFVFVRSAHGNIFFRLNFLNFLIYFPYFTDELS